MSEKRIYGRAVQKHDVEKNWIKATNFIPMAGEIIVYDRDDNVTDESLKGTYSYERIKIGDGIKNVNALHFVDDALRTELLTQISDVDNKVDAVSALVGDTKVSDQIAAANMIYVGPDRPTDPNIKVWINTAEEGTGIVPVMPRIATINLAASAWIGNSAPYSQVVEIATVTQATKVELNPTVAQIVSMQSEDIALTAENNNGVVTAYSFGGKPSTDMTMQVTLTEVSYV